MAALTSCEPNEQTGITEEEADALSPERAAVVPGSTRSFTLTNGGTPVSAASWEVNGIPSGNASVGTISASGVYSAPSTMPTGDTVRITGRSGGGGGTFSARVFFVPALSPASDYSMQSPRVVDLAAPEITRLLVVLAAGSNVRSIAHLSGQVNTPLTDLGNGVHLLELSGAAATAGYTVGALHNAIGTLVHRDAGGATVITLGLSVNVRDATAPAVSPTQLAADAQRSRNVLNIRVDAPSLGTLTSAPVSRALQLLGDRFDQVAVVSNVRSTNNRYHQSVRNAVQGIGMSVFNNGTTWGSAAKLLGVNYFPLDTYFDAGETAYNHEFGHQWVNFSGLTLFSPGVPHWPPSDIANHLMGFSIGGTGGQGGQFPYGLTSVGGGQYRVDNKTPPQTYGPWDLYLMGLLPADSVPPALIFPQTWSVGQTVTPTSVTISQYISAHGARVPSSAATPRTFSVATVVLSSGRLLNAAEMAFFDANAARAEATVALPFSIGFASGMTLPFRLATGGRATIVTRVD